MRHRRLHPGLADRRHAVRSGRTILGRRPPATRHRSCEPPRRLEWHNSGRRLWNRCSHVHRYHGV